MITLGPIFKLNCIALFVYKHKITSRHPLPDTILLVFSEVNNIWPIVRPECWEAQ